MLENFQARPLLMKAIELRKFGDLPDPRMGNRFDENEMFHMIGAAAACIRHSAAMRPRMGQVTYSATPFFFVSLPIPERLATKDQNVTFCLILPGG
jgi:hypothetical protein